MPALLSLDVGLDLGLSAGLGAAAALLVGVILLRDRKGLAPAILGCVAALPALMFQPVFEAGHAAGRQPALLLQAIAPDLTVAHRGAPMARALLGSLDGAWPADLIFSVGLPALLLALLGVCCARGLSSWIGRAMVGLGLCLAFVPPGALAPAALPCLVLGLALLAGGGLSALLEQRAADPAMVLSWVAVALAAGLSLAALQAGAATDTEALTPWLRDASPSLPAEASPLAAALRSVLDRAALSAFAAMTMLLVFLRYRGRLGTGLLLLLAALDASRPWWLP